MACMWQSRGNSQKDAPLFPARVFGDCTQVIKLVTKGLYPLPSHSPGSLFPNHDSYDIGNSPSYESSTSRKVMKS